MYTTGNVIRAVSISGIFIYYSNYKIILPLIKSLLDPICYPSKYYKGVYENLEVVFYAVRYINPNKSKQRQNR